jgi:hypothetical protein
MENFEKYFNEDFELQETAELDEAGRMLNKDNYVLITQDDLQTILKSAAELASTPAFKCTIKDFYNIPI